MNKSHGIPHRKDSLKFPAYLVAMRQRLILVFISLVPSLQAQEVTQTFTVMAWNILHGAGDIPDGREHATEIIRAIDPDIVLMVETYGSGPAIADALGLNFHLIAPEGTAPDDKNINLSIMSRFPFGKRFDTDHPFYLGGREVLIGDRVIRCFANWFHYDPWEDQPENLGKSVEELLAWERTGKKYEMLQQVLPYFTRYTSETDSFPMILGGDMNTPSHLDWGVETQALHKGLVVPWHTTKTLEDLGFVDSYRTFHPNPVSHPGITWNAKGKKDEHRIDYIFYKGKQFNLIHAESHQAYLGEPLEIKGKKIPYPSDHGFVVSVFELP